MELKNLLRTARRRWKAITAMVVLGLIVSAVVSYLTPKEYESTAKIYVTVDTELVAELYSGSVYVAGRIKSYADVANHRELMVRLIDDLGLDTTPSELSGQVRAEVEPDTVIVQFTVTDRDPVRAQAIAQAGAGLFVDYIEELETPRGEIRPQVNAAITDPPTVNTQPVSPQVALNLTVAGMIGLMLGIGLAAIREVLDNTVKLPEDIQEVTGAPVMASVGSDRKVSRDPLLTDISGFSPRGEAFRLLRTNLQYLDIDEQPKSLVITSAIAGEGKTHTATNLAIALAQAGQKVILVDGDLRRPRVAEMLGLDRSIGLTTVLVGRTTLEDGIQVHAPSGVHALTSGPTPPNPTEVLQTRATRELLARLRATYDAVIIDAPPLLPVSDASILGTAADGMVLVARFGKTRREELSMAAQRIKGVGGRLFGVVVNMVPKRAAEGYHYYYYYESAAEAPGARKKAPNTEVTTP